MFTPYSLIPATAPTPSVLGNLQSGTNTNVFGNAVLGAGQAPIQQPTQPTTQQQQNNQQQLSNTSAAAQNSTNQTTVLTGSQSGQANSNLASTTTQQNPSLSYISEPNKALGLTTNTGQVTDMLSNYYKFNPGGPNQQQIQDFANQLTSGSNAYQTTSRDFGRMYDDVINGRVSEQDLPNVLAQMQELSRTATGQYNTVNNLFNTSWNQPQQSIAGMGLQRNTFGLNPAQQFVLPEKTWNMNSSDLINWINARERSAGSMGFLDKALGMAGMAAITGAAAGGLTGITDPFSLTNAAVSTGIKYGTGMNR